MSQDEKGNAEAIGLGYSTTSQGVVSDILRECWAYHEQQERIRNLAKTSDAPDNALETPHFVPAAVPWRFTDGTLDDPKADTVASQALLGSNELLQKRVDAARERARAVLKGFHQPHHNRLVEQETANFREQRLKGFQREDERRQQALLRNWAYLMERQNRRAEQLTAQVSSSKALKTEVEQQYNAVLQKRMELLQQKGGVPGQPPRPRKTTKGNQGPPPDTVVVYWVTQPPHSFLEESDMRLLFGPYGTIHKIVQYRNKETGLLKGDGLIVYRINEEADVESQDLIRLVCGQMNGAELPNGSILHVEPAISKNRIDQNPSLSPNEMALEEVGPPKVEETNAPMPQDQEQRKSHEPNDSDDLDEFFESL